MVLLRNPAEIAAAAAQILDRRLFMPDGAAIDFFLQPDRIHRIAYQRQCGWAMVHGPLKRGEGVWLACYVDPIHRRKRLGTDLVLMVMRSGDESVQHGLGCKGSDRFFAHLAGLDGLAGRLSR